MARAKKIETTSNNITAESIAAIVARMMAQGAAAPASVVKAKGEVMAKGSKPVAPFMTWTPIENPEALRLATAVKKAQADLLAWARANYAPADNNSVVQVSTSYGRLTVASVRGR